LSLPLRGGGGGGGSSPHDAAAVRYSTVGIVRLLPPSDHGGEDSANVRLLARRLEQELLPRPPVDTDGAVAKIMALPTAGSGGDGDSDALVGTFVGPPPSDSSSEMQIQQQQVASCCEAVGTLSDVVFVLLPAHRSERGRDDGVDADMAVEALRSVLQGLARRMSGGGGDGPRPRLVLYVCGNDNGNHHQRYAKSLLASALTQLRDDRHADPTFWVWRSVRNLQADVDVAVLPYSSSSDTNDDEVAEMAAAGKILASSVPGGPRAVPLEAFPELVREVHRALTRGAEVQTAVDFKFVGGGWSVSEEMESDAEVLIESYGDEQDDSIEDELVPDQDIPSEEVIMDNDEILSQLTAASRRILLECEGQLSALEAKQDDFLLNSEEGMPILEFGTDAQAVIEHALDSFDDAVDDLRASVGDDEEMQVTIQGKMICAASFIG